MNVFKLSRRKYWNKGLSTQWPGLSATEHLREFITGKGAMIWDGCMLIQTLKNEPAVDFDWDEAIA